MKKLTFAFCTYQRAARLERLVAEMRDQECPLPFEILAVNNNSQDSTLQVLERLASQPGPPLRYVTESEQGIVPARNRALAEALHSDIIVFIDDDERPLPGLLQGACRAILEEGASCAGGRINIDFSEFARPAWMGDDLLGFLGALDYGTESFWIRDAKTPIWSGNVAYNTQLFRSNPDLRFDKRYNRVGVGTGGGEDGAMFESLLARGVPIRYCSAMAVVHSVEPWRLKREYFLALHYRAGIRYGRYYMSEYPKGIFRIPPFMIRQLLQQCWKAVVLLSSRRNDALRQAMNAAHALGAVVGYRMRMRA